jgi:hypothetical protein
MKIGHESRDSLSDTMIRKTILFFPFQGTTFKCLTKHEDDGTGTCIRR